MGLYFLRGGRSALRGDRPVRSVGNDPILRYTAFGLPDSNPRLAIVAGIVTAVIGAAIALVGVGVAVVWLLHIVGLV